MDRNYIRVDSLSFASIEIYALGFLLLCFLKILLGRNNKPDVKLIYMYLLSLPFTDMVYRLAGMQIAELISIMMIFVNLTNRDIRISKNYVIKFMLFFVVLLFLSSLISFLNNSADYQFITLSQRALPFMYCIKFFLHIYMVNRIIICIKERHDLDSVIKVIKFSGNIAAVVTLLQVLLYKLGFVVPGIFEMWNIPRAKGLSHEPATNSFILLTTIIISTFYFKGSIKLYFKSFVLQFAAFLICFSSGALAIFMVYVGIYTFMSIIKMKMSLQKLVIIHIMLPIVLIVGIYLVGQTDFITQINNVYDKILALGSDYTSGTNVSGRGADIVLIETVRQTHPWLGLGAFNTLTIFPDLPLTNMYFILYAELGMLGSIVLGIGTAIFGFNMFKTYMKNRGHNLNLNLIIFSLASLLIIAWIRVLFFPQIWLVFGLFYAISKVHVHGESKVTEPVYPVPQRSVSIIR